MEKLKMLPATRAKMKAVTAMNQNCCTWDRPNRRTHWKSWKITGKSWKREWKVMESPEKTGDKMLMKSGNLIEIYWNHGESWEESANQHQSAVAKKVPSWAIKAPTVTNREAIGTSHPFHAALGNALPWAAELLSCWAACQSPQKIKRSPTSGQGVMLFMS